MRKWLWFGVASACLGGAGVWYYLHPQKAAPHYALERPIELPNGYTFGRAPKETSEEETSDAVEPSIIESSDPGSSPGQGNWTFEVLPLPRVVLAPGMAQPPRPDADTNKFVRMPYADEEEIVDGAFNPVPRFLETILRKLNLFQEPPSSPAEESEAKDEPAPAVEPEPDTEPPMDYHHRYPSCPYTGDCPYPYSRRP